MTIYGASESVESAYSGDGPYGEVKIEKTDGSCSKLRRQMAAAAGKKGTTSLFIFMEVFGLEVEEEFSTLATQIRAEGVWVGTWCTEQREAWLNQVLEVQIWRQARGLAGAVVCETRDLGIEWPQRHTLTFEAQVQVDMRYICPNT